MQPEITVVCSTYRRPERLSGFLAALERQDLEPDRFVVAVVDNGSHDTTAETLAKLAASTSLNLTPLSIEVNRGPAAARNLGWRSTSTPYVAFTDDDCVTEPSWLRTGLELMKSDPTLGIVQGQTKPFGPIGVHTLVREVRPPGSPFMEGCNIFYRRDALEATGGFDEEIGWYGEDTALGWAVLAHGWRKAFAEDAVVLHPVEERPMRWHIQSAWLEGNMVKIAHRYPDFAKEAFRRPWCFHPQDARTALAMAGVVLALKKPWALILIYPWWRMRRPPEGHERPVGLTLERALLDVTSVTGMALASVRERHVVI